MKEYLTYGFAPEFPSERQREKLIVNTRRAVEAWNEALDSYVFRYQSRNPDVTVFGVTPKVLDQWAEKWVRERITEEEKVVLGDRLEEFIEKTKRHAIKRFRRTAAAKNTRWDDGSHHVLVRGWSNDSGVLTHEFGHALGLPHNRCGDSVMHNLWRVWPDKPTVFDVQRVRELISRSMLGCSLEQSASILN